MKDKKILLFDAKPYDIEFFNDANKKYSFDIKYQKNHLSAETAAFSKGFDAACVFVNDPVTKEIIDIFMDSGVKVIALRSAGYNNVDLKAAYGKMHVVRVPEYSPYAVAEHAAALMLTLNRKTHRAYFRTRDNNFSIAGLMGFDMREKTAGIIGTGKIGKVLIGILKGFGMKVLAYDLHPDKEFAEKNGFEYVDLDAIYASSDIISLHCPLTKETNHLINSESIAKMKKGVMIINTGRGKLIDTKALIDNLKNGKIGYAGLDVYEEESEYFFEDLSSSVIADDVLERLLTFNNVLLTSHQAFFTREALSKIADVTLGNLEAYFGGKYLENEICYRCDSAVCKRKNHEKCF